MDAYVLEQLNAMPAPTWHRLNMNSTDVEVPGSLEAVSDVVVQADPDAFGDADAFDRAMSKAQEARMAARPAPERTCVAEETFDNLALSAYQARAAAIEDARDIRATFETGMGEAGAAFLNTVAGDPIVIVSKPNAETSATLRLTGVDGAVNACAVDVVAAENSVVNLTVSVDSPALGAGFVGTELRVFAGKGSQVNIARTQTLDSTWTDLDDMGLFADDGARISIRETVLGAAKVYGGIGGDLRGDAARIDIDLRYLGHGALERDFNYSLRHHGLKTECAIKANGVLAGSSKKVLRGTIDLVRGCKGSAGQENETVLLVDNSVTNLTVPVILCNEDDVSGNHGATIGHVRDEQMLYLACRGISRDAAEKMFVRAIMEQAALEAPDETTCRSVLRLGDTILGNFSARLAEDGE